jgi:hypothetical protein
MKCTCLTNGSGVMLVRDPWCPWHGDIEFPKQPLGGPRKGLYDMQWPLPSALDIPWAIRLSGGPYNSNPQGL